VGHIRHRPKRVVGRNHLSQVAIRAAVGAIGSSGCTGQVIPRSYDEKIGQAPASHRLAVERRGEEAGPMSSFASTTVRPCVEPLVDGMAADCSEE
jgi:hypothetical protein